MEYIRAMQLVLLIMCSVLPTSAHKLWCLLQYPLTHSPPTVNPGPKEVPSTSSAIELYENRRPPFNRSQSSLSSVEGEFILLTV